MYFSQLEEIVDGSVVQLKEDSKIEFLITDSRKIFVHPFALFIASKGVRHDGHKYIEEVYKKGIRQFLIEEVKGLSLSKFPLANFYKTNDSLKALQRIAANHRSKFDLETIAITGSNGKTIVKEWLSQLLTPDYTVVKSPKSYNSQLGVPLSVWEINDQHTFGIFEAGISKPHEMENLEKIIQPSLGLITNLGSAHDEGFEDAGQKLEEKCKLFINCKKIFYCRDHHQIHEYLSKSFNPERLVSWSSKEAADLSIKTLEKESETTKITYTYLGEEADISLPFTDDASIENGLHCLLVLHVLNIPQQQIREKASVLRKVSMRLELKQGVNNCYIIDDSYNNDLAGLEIALDFLNQQNQRPNKTLILSDVLESGMPETDLYKSIAELIGQKGVSKLIGIGPTISKHWRLFPDKSVFYPNTIAFLSDYKFEDFDNEVILVKGARVFTFEKITQALQYKVHGTVLEINLDALSNNLNFYRSRLAPVTKIMVMVKAFAYGSGSHEVANLLQFHKVDYLAVAYPDEGVSLRKNGITLPIMVMNPTADAFGKMLEYKLEPEIYSPMILSQLASFLKGTSNMMNIHIELETGMQRLGFDKEQLKGLFSILRENQNIKVVSVFSHLAGSDEAMHNDFSKEQIRKFEDLSAEIEHELEYPVIKHVLNSSGIIRFPEHQFDMVRLGIGLYGVEVNEQFQDKLQPISTLKTTISQIKHIAGGETVGYGRKGKTTKDTVIATIALGYADGFSRSFSGGKGKVCVNGKLVPVIGNVCMDMTMIDITGVKAKEGDEVIVFGKDPSIREVAKWIDTIPYEILTNISERVKRVYFME
ncbi:MAG TPA: bifunctional UDP-N-acetylmuramoyl-tripeptide:D-alanyl-D-alanine ligase/alanine racemase [Cytophagales bacterium]|nr:bifunctional UDP-N-acetylmuramoyl-tripeptide:D-alanyl-D-alanine ligase/alanine racemase [Cytophagales bacterium]